MTRSRFRYWFWSTAADIVHGIRYALVPILDFCWKKRDAAHFDFGGKK